MGVYGNFTLDPVPPEKQFTSSLKILNLDRMEQQVAHLSAPKWPEEHFGAIDKAKADAGKKLYAETCVKCHFVRGDSGAFPMTAPNKFGKQFVRTVMVPVAAIGTGSDDDQTFHPHGRPGRAEAARGQRAGDVGGDRAGRR
jgi:mono/diheme cytochrome c family protein